MASALISEYTRAPGQVHPPCFDLFPEYRLALSSYLQQNSQALQKWGKATRRYPDGSTETTIYPMPPALGRRVDRGRKDEDRDAVTTAPRDIAKESAQRAARIVRRTARYRGMKNMLTLTFPGAGVHDYDQAYRCVAAWLHHAGGAYMREHGGYLVAFELHPGGHGYHAHILFSGPRLSLGVLRSQRASWTAHVARAGLSGGHRGVVRTHVKRWSSERSAACYAAKYVSKTFEGEEHKSGRHRYLRSEGMSLPSPEYETWSHPLLALASCGHPGFWERFYDARPSGRPFLWMAFSPEWEPPPDQPPD